MWPLWGRNNQEDPENYPLIPHSSFIESLEGLQRVRSKIIETQLPRLPWGSKKALLIGLQSEQDSLDNLESELKTAKELLMKVQFEVEEILFHESQPENDLRAKLASNHWDIIHFSGHFSNREGQFIGHAWDLGVNDFVASCCRAAPPRMVVLNACSSGGESVHQDRPTGISGTIAEQFCLRGVDAVVATRWDILDDVALCFATEFYSSFCMQCEDVELDSPFSVDIETCLLDARKSLNKSYLGMDAAWLAYCLYRSRADGCIFLPELIRYPTFVPNGKHPVLYSPEHHTRLCEHLAPGGAGLYFLTGPAGCGKTTSARLALQSLGIEMDIFSLRHDDALVQIDYLFEELKKNTAPLIPVVFDDAEALIPMIMQYREKLHQISKHLPVLLVFRVDDQTSDLMEQLSSIIPNESPDELMFLFPNIINEKTLAIYLHTNYGIKLTETELHLLIVRIQNSFFGFSDLFQSFQLEKLDLDLLEPRKGARIYSRMENISSDEVLALQTISRNYDPSCVHFRSQIAWQKLLEDGIVSSTPMIFSKLEQLGLIYSTQTEYIEFSVQDIEQLPDELRIPALNVPPKIIEGLGTNPELLKLMVCYTVHHEVLDIIRNISDDERLEVSEFTFSSAFFATNMTNIKRHKDGFDTRDGLARLNSMLGNQIEGATANSLLMVLESGGGTERDHLSDYLLNRLKEPSYFIAEILSHEVEVLTCIKERLPSLRFSVVLDLARFFQKYCHRFSDDGYKFSMLIVSLGTRFSEEPNILKSMSHNWEKLIQKSEQKIAKHGSELDKSSIAFEKKKANLLTLFRTKSNRERQKELVECLQTILIDDIKDPWQHSRLLLEGCQVSYRHLLFRANSSTMSIFGKLCEKFTEVFLENKDNNIVLHNRAREISAKLIWFNTGYVLLRQRKKVIKEGNPQSELRWIRDLLEAGPIIGQVSPYFARCMFSEAISRLFSIRYRKRSWYENLNKYPKKERVQIQKALAALTRRCLDIVVEDAGTQKEEIRVIEDLLPHMFNTYDKLNRQSPLARMGSYQFPIPDQVTLSIHSVLSKKMIPEIWPRLADKTRDLSVFLDVRSATNLELDKYLGARDAIPIGRISKFLFLELKQLGSLARDIAKFAIAYPETLTNEEKELAEEIIAIS